MIAQSPVRNDVNLMCTNSGIDVHHIPGPYWNTQSVQNDLNSRSTTNTLYRSHSPNLLINQANNNKLIRQSIENISLTNSPPNSVINYHTKALNDAITNYPSGCLLNSTLSNLILPPPLLTNQPPSQTPSLTGIPSLLTPSTPSCISSPLSSSGQNFSCVQTNNNFINSLSNLPNTTTINDNSQVNHLRCNGLMIPSNANNGNTTVINTTSTTVNTTSNNSSNNNNPNINQSHFLNERSAPPFQQLVRIF